MRAILRAFLVIALLLVVGFVLFGYWTSAPWLSTRTTAAVAGRTTGTATEMTRERGAELRERAAGVAQEVGNTVGVRVAVLRSS
jgi:hypothetical protein